MLAATCRDSAYKVRNCIVEEPLSVPKLGFFASSRVSENGISRLALSLLDSKLVYLRTITIILRQRLWVNGIGQVVILINVSVSFWDFLSSPPPCTVVLV